MDRIEAYWEAEIERRAREMCMTEFGGYPVDKEKREAWPSWRACRDAASFIVNFKRSALAIERESATIFRPVSPV